MLTMERHRYTDNRREYELKSKTSFLEGKHHKQLHHNSDVIKSLVSKSSRSFADDVSNDQLEVRHHRHRRHHNHHNHHHRHRGHRHRHHNSQKITAYNDDDDEPRVEGKMLEGDLEDISSELDDVDKQRVQQQLPTSQLAIHHSRSRLHLDSPAVISVSSSHSSLSNKNYSHSPAVVVDSESPHGHNNQPSSPGKLKLHKIRYPKRSQPPTPTSSAKRSRTASASCSPSRSRSQSLAASDSEASKTASSHSSRYSSDSSSDSRESNISRSSSDASRTSKHSADKDEVSKDADKVTNNGVVVEKTVSSNLEEKPQTEEINGDNKIEKCKLPDYYPGVQGCRSVEEFQCLNRIEEGTYGVVYRAKDKKTDELVALKRLKMEKETEGFPITSLREINTLLKGQHPNIVTVREIVVGSNMDQIFIVMDYVEHDLKSLMQTMKSRKQSFLPSEVKCLTQQLLCAVAHLHDNWILHRDLKTSNLLLSHKGILKVADFGLAREYGSPLKRYTPVVVTLWYRAPELLLCSPEYSTPVDMWSVGCIFAEMIRMHPLFTGQTEIDQLSRIYKELGTPNEKIWPGYKDLPAVKNMLSQNSQFTEYPISNLKKRFANNTTEIGIDLLQGMLTYDPERRLSAEKALQHEYFKELPLPIDPSMFPTWPAKSELGERKQAASPKPPPGGTQFKQQLDALDGRYTKGAGFQLKF